MHPYLGHPTPHLLRISSLCELWCIASRWPQLRPWRYAPCIYIADEWEFVGQVQEVHRGGLRPSVDRVALESLVKMPYPECCPILNVMNQATPMQLTLDDAKTKELLTEVLVELIQQNRSLFHELILDALEEVGLANAIAEGEDSEFVEEDEIRALLER